MRYWLLFLCCFFSLTVSAQEWVFSEAVVVAKPMQGVFHHLDASSRRAIAVSNGTVAIVWEDNRGGTPQIYAALKKTSDKSFQQPIQISDKGPAYEAGISALDDGRFVVAWEADDQLWLRVLDGRQAGEIRTVSQNPSRQIALGATPGNGLVAVWAQQVGKTYLIHVANLRVEKNAIKMSEPIRVDNTEASRDQLYPSVQRSVKGTVVAWEDRRFGNTQIFTAFAKSGKKFQKYQPLNDYRKPRVARFGVGSGAMRVALGGDGKNQVVATWLDKRNFEGGYDVYAALSLDGGKSFSEDEIAQDMFGENTPQWHNAVAVSPNGKIIVAWDDTRDGTPNVWFSERVDGEWSADSSFVDAEDSVKITHPVVSIDAQERLHIAYIEQRQAGSQVKYILGIKQ